jgi:hypothetical protein
MIELPRPSKAAPMSDPLPGPDPSAGSHGGEPVSREETLDRVRAVYQWYAQEVGAEMAAPAPDPARLAELRDEMRACLADQRELPDAGPDRLARIAADYLRRYRELTRS